MALSHIRAAVLGSPIAHSKSPLLHAAGYEALGVTGWDYTRVELDEEAFDGWLQSRGFGWRGVSVTMPLKGAALESASWTDELAELTGAANTLVFATPEPDAPCAAWNTDIHGIAEALREAGTVSAPQVDILGAGASCASAIAALTSFDAQKVRIIARSETRAAGRLELVERLGMQAEFVPLAEWGSACGSTLVMSTLPGTVGGSLHPCEEFVAESALFDVVYAPWPSPLATRWFAAERGVIGGEAMLLHQAVEQLRLMTSVRSDEEHTAWGLPNIDWDHATVVRVTAALRAALASA